MGLYPGEFSAAACPGAPLEGGADCGGPGNDMDCVVLILSLRPTYGFAMAACSSFCTTGLIVSLCSIGVGGASRMRSCPS